MADEGKLNHHLGKIEGRLAIFSANDPEKCKIFLEKMLKIAIEHLDQEALAQITFPPHMVKKLLDGIDVAQPADEEDSSDDQDDVEMTDDQLISIPDHLKELEDRGRRRIYVVDLYLERGPMSNVLSIILEVAGITRPVSIPGGYSQSIDRYMHTHVVERADGKDEKDVWIQTHPETRAYFARVFSFNLAHKLNETHRYDIAVKSEPHHFSLHIDVEECDFLGEVPTVNGTEIDLAVQQGHTVFGFNLEEYIQDSVTYPTVIRQQRSVTTPLRPGGGRVVDMSPHMLSPVNLDHLFVAKPIVSFKRPRKVRRPPGTSGPGGSGGPGGPGSPGPGSVKISKSKETKL